MTASVGNPAKAGDENSTARTEIRDSILRLFSWLEKNDYRGYDTFDGLNARFVRPLTFENKLLRTVLQQGVRRFPVNLRPLLGVDKEQSTKAMGFLARGFLRLHKATGEALWAEKAKFALQWLIDHHSPGYSGACWGNHFDYQSRSFYLPKGTPTIVWSSLIARQLLFVTASRANQIEGVSMPEERCRRAPNTETVLRKVPTFRLKSLQLISCTLLYTDVSEWRTASKIDARSSDLEVHQGRATRQSLARVAESVGGEIHGEGSRLC
jgi:hypothetical protein